MFGKHALAAKILQEAKDQGITLAVAKPIDDTEYKYGSVVGTECYPDIAAFPESHEDIPIVSPAMVPKLTGMTAEAYLNLRQGASYKELLDVIGRKTPREELRDMSITRIDKFTPMQLEEYQKRQDKLHADANKMTRDAEMIERANAHLRKFDLTEENLKLALKYISSMMPRRYQLSTDGKVSELDYPSRYGNTKRMEYVIEDTVSGFSITRPLNVIDGVICIRSGYPRFIKGAFEFELKQHLDYESRFKKRDQERFNTNFTKR